MKNIFWTGYSNGERHAAINSIQRIVSKYGSIIDFKPFTDMALTFVIEIQTSKINSLYEELKDNLSLDSYEQEDPPARKEATIFLNVSFSKGTGNLKIEVPAVPG